MPTVYGHRLRWVEDQVPCTECGAPHDESWFMVSVMPGDKLLCRTCLSVWKEQEKSEQDVDELFANVPRRAGRRVLS
jgi:hypothetical protein